MRYLSILQDSNNNNNFYVLLLLFYFQKTAIVNTSYMAATTFILQNNPYSTSSSTKTEYSVRKQNTTLYIVCNARHLAVCFSSCSWSQLSIMPISLVTSSQELNCGYARIIFITLQYCSIPVYSNNIRYRYQEYLMKTYESIFPTYRIFSIYLISYCFDNNLSLLQHIICLSTRDNT